MDRTVRIDDLVIGVELSQRHPDVHRLLPLLSDESIEAALGVGLDGLHRPGAVEQYSDERVLGIRHGNSLGRWKTAISGYVRAPTTLLISRFAVSEQQTFDALCDADGGARQPKARGIGW